jgi:hypothetical protein
MVGWVCLSAYLDSIAVDQIEDHSNLLGDSKRAIEIYLIGLMEAFCLGFNLPCGR